MAGLLPVASLSFPFRSLYNELGLESEGGDDAGDEGVGSAVEECIVGVEESIGVCRGDAGRGVGCESSVVVETEGEWAWFGGEGRGDRGSIS